ncbi:type II toxin-antitoxin system VapC family toxin [Ignisphaera sp. 4213-co]|uniref:Type II toxin-antitoxin system VapC family toxin n=1 Tax=Ignisphaera cupida TaxID=3050454 RepID=A0ABD4Z6F2_9CREN|nr:type II toxin-antitoxin system VapC family toxin [Ignisphaera sp. 4213-co]MDK6028896.1 type II toxin-antitoxin system VapC family toxin [Ignisphaera sp. 4213-co]
MNRSSRTIYIDTNVIISYVDEADPNHEKVVALVDNINGKRVVSKLTLVELASVYSRAGLRDPLPLAIYSTRRVGAELVEIDFNDVLKESFTYAPILKLKTLDLLHIVACSKAMCSEFVTLDTDIIRKANEIRNVLNINVITPLKT